MNNFNKKMCCLGWMCHYLKQKIREKRFVKSTVLYTNFVCVCICFICPGGALNLTLLCNSYSLTKILVAISILTSCTNFTYRYRDTHTEIETQTEVQRERVKGVNNLAGEGGETRGAQITPGFYTSWFFQRKFWSKTTWPLFCLILWEGKGIFIGKGKNVKFSCNRYQNIIMYINLIMIKSNLKILYAQQ